MAIELRNPLTITEETKIYGHNTVDIDGVPTDAGNGNVGQIVDIVDTKYIQGIKTDIDNIKAKINGEIYRTQLVDANAYQIDVPSHVFPYAEVQKIKGKSVVWNQLIEIRDSNYSYEGITFTKQADGTFLANGTSTKNDGDYINKGGSSGFKIVSNHNYYIWGSDYGGTDTNCMAFQIKRTNGTYMTKKQGSNLGILYTTVDLDNNGSGSIFYYVANGTTLNNVKVSVNVADLTLMFGAGNEPTLEECQKIFTADYYPYDAGTLKSFPVKRVKSVGMNLLKPTLQSETKYGVTCTNNGDGTYTVNGTSTIEITFTIGLVPSIFGMNYRLTGCPSGGSKTTFFLASITKDEQLFVAYDIGNGATYIPSNDTIPIRIYVKKNTTISNLVFKPMVTTDLNATYDDFVPYWESIIDLSSATADMKSALSVADEWQNGKVTKRIGVVDMGTLSWNYYNRVFYADILNKRKVTNSNINAKSHLLCEKFVAVNITSEMDCNNGEMYEYAQDNNPLRVCFKNETYTNVSDFKSAMSGVMLYYELDTPTEETVPLTEQFIDVESNGTLTFISDENVQMPIESTTKFVVNLEEV